MWNIISNFAEKIVGAIAGTIYYLENLRNMKRKPPLRSLYIKAKAFNLKGRTLIEQNYKLNKHELRK